MKPYSKGEEGCAFKSRKSRFDLYACSVSVIALTLVTSPVYAQETKQEVAKNSETVVISGIRKSLKNAQDIKKASEVIVDSITAEDIGALPDRSVTEALSRVPGVSINRFAAGVDPDHFSVEGSGVTVRGLNLTRSELNGRDTFSANNGRSLSFADVPSELMAGVDVFKNPSADMIEGGIAGTVNLRTRLPFDSKKQVISLSVENSYGDFAKTSKPTFSGLYSNSWDTSIGKIGILANYVNSKLMTRSDGAQISNYACRTNINIPNKVANCNGVQGIYYPRGAAIRSQTTEREREGMGFAAQWKSNDDSMLATLQFLRSDAKQAWTEHAIEIATDNVANNGDSFPVFGTSTLADATGLFQSGTISSASTGWRDDVAGGALGRTPIYGPEANNIYRNQKQNYITSDLSFGFKWNINQNWGMKLDLQHVDSNVDVLDNTIWGASYQDVRIQTRGKEIPIIDFLPPTKFAANGTACNPVNGGWDTSSCGTYLSTGNLSSLQANFWRAAMDHAEQSEGTEDAARLDFEYKFNEGDGWLKAIDFGARYSERDQTTRFSVYNWGVLSESWGSGGEVWMDEPLKDGATNSQPNVSNFTFDNFMKGGTQTPLNASRPYYNGNTVTDMANFYKFALNVGDTFRARNNGKCADGVKDAPQNWVPLGLRCDVTAGSIFRPNEVNPVVEKNTAFYVMTKFGHEYDTGVKVSGNFGVRYTKTERASQGYASFPQGSSLPTDADCNATPVGQAPSPFCLLTVADRNKVRVFSDGHLVNTDANVSYDYWLPSFNLRISPIPSVNLRLGISKTLTNPDVGLLRNYYNISLNTSDAVGYYNGLPSGTSQAGNPRLRPTTSENIDLSAEWYFAPVGSVTLALFDKTLSGVVSNTTERVSFTNNGTTITNIVTTPGNSTETGRVRGWEFAYQQVFSKLPSPFDGLGTNFNYSFIDSKGVSQSTLSATDPDVAAGRVTVIDASKLPLQGLSKHNANLALFYEKYGISARVAYNYRSDFLVTVRDVIVPFQPIMQAGGGQIDGSIFYQLTPQIKIGLQGQNLNNEVTRTKAIIATEGDNLIKAGRSWFVNDRRIDFIIRATF